MRVVNTICVNGNLAKDAELRQKKNGSPVLAFTIAQTNLHRDRATGKTVSRPNHFQCTCFGGRAAEIAPMLVKGTGVTVAGRLRSSEWEHGGERRYQVDILVDHIAFDEPPAPKAEARAGKAPSRKAAPEAPVPPEKADAEPEAAAEQLPDEAELEDEWPFDFDFDFDEEE